MKRKGVLNAVLKAMLAGVETSAAVKIPATFISELADLPEEEQEKLTEIGQEQLNILIQSRLATINSAVAATNTEQIKETLKELMENVRQLGTEEKKVAEQLIYLPEGRNEYFTGREGYLEKLAEQLENGKKAAVTQAQAIKGLGGIGKTQLALEYAWENKDKKYKTIVWLGAENEQSLAKGLEEIVRQLGMEAGKYKQNAEMVRGWLETKKERWLIVFDNVDEPKVIKRCLPREGDGHIIITTRRADVQELGEVGMIALDKMEADEAVDFIFRRTGYERTVENEKSAGEIAEEVGYLPLALEQAAGYIKSLGTGLREYLDAYREEGARIFAKEQARVRMGDYGESVVTTWGMNFRQVRKASEAAGDLLTCAAFVHADGIPLRLIREAGDELGERIGEKLEQKLGLEEMLEVLGRYSLIKREGESFSMHRLVQEVVRNNLSRKEQKEWAGRCIKALGAVWPDQTEIGNWPWCAELTPHGMRAAEWVEECKFEFEGVASFLNNFAYYLDGQAQYGAAEPMYRRALEIDEKTLGPEHPKVAIRLNNLAELLRKTNRLSEAEPLYRRALEIDEKNFGPDHPKVAIRLNNMAVLLKTTNRLEEAEPLYRRALEIDEKKYGPDHPDVATDLNNLAELLRVRREYKEAEPLTRRALRIWEKSLGKDHPNVASALNNLGGLLQAMNRLEEAEPLYRRALEINEKIYGLEHPDVAIDLNNLAGLLRDTNRRYEAEPMLRRAVEILEKSLGPEHPRTRRVRRNLEIMNAELGIMNEEGK